MTGMSFSLLFLLIVTQLQQGTMNFTKEEIQDFTADADTLFKEGAELLAAEKRGSSGKETILEILKDPDVLIKELENEVEAGYNDLTDDVKGGFNDVVVATETSIESVVDKIGEKLIWPLLILFILKWIIGECRKKSFNRKVDQRIADLEAV